MNFFRIFFLTAAMFPTALQGAERQEKPIAVVKSAFDRIEIILKVYRIPHKIITYTDLEKKSTFSQYRAIFFPCGMRQPAENKVRVLSGRQFIQSVVLKKNHYQINREMVVENVKDFIREGGTGYITGYSFDLIQESFKPFDFFRDFPHAGMHGRYVLNLRGGLSRFCEATSMEVTMPHSGWVLAKNISDCEILAEGEFTTPMGDRKGPIAAIFARGNGELLFSSYHTENPGDEIMRFMVYRTAYKNLTRGIEQQIAKWNLEKRDVIIDSILAGEWGRSYRVLLSEGKNTIYFTSQKGVFQVDLYDKNMNLVVSSDAKEKKFLLDIRSGYKGEHVLKVFRTKEAANVPFTVITASGWRIIPYITFLRVLITFAVIVIVSILFSLVRGPSPNYIAGRIRR